MLNLDFSGVLVEKGAITPLNFMLFAKIKRRTRFFCEKRWPKMRVFWMWGRKSLCFTGFILYKVMKRRGYGMFLPNNPAFLPTPAFFAF